MREHRSTQSVLAYCIQISLTIEVSLITIEIQICMHLEINTERILLP